MMNMKQLLKKLNNLVIGGKTMMINYFAMQINLGWITLEQVPKRFRKRVQELVEMAELGAEEKKGE